MNEPQPQERKKVYRMVDEHDMIFLFMPCPRKLKGMRGHHPNNDYATWRSPMRDARRQVGPISGRQWVKFRKFGSKAYRAFKAKQLMEGIINE